MDRLFIILYELSLWVIAFLALPKLLYNFFIHKKYRKSLWARLGFNNPLLQRVHPPLIWIHAVSVGETKAVVTLARELKRQFTKCQIIISSITETGHAEAKRSFPFADHHIYLPFDFNLLIHRLLTQAPPDLVILCESDLWYNFLRLAKQKGACVALVNGKISERSTWRFNQIPFFSRRLFNLFDVLCLQNNLYKERFVKAGAPPDRLLVTGNLKLDEEYPHLSVDESAQWRQRLGVSSRQLVLTIGSTHDSEEQILLRVLKISG